MQTIGFIGFGEAASAISEGLIGQGVRGVYAFDVQAGLPRIQERAAKLGVQLVHSLSDLASRVHLIVCATSAKYAEQIAFDILPFLTSEHLYVDFNAASPMTMENIEDAFHAKQVPFIDAAVMEPVPLHKHAVPILVSGNQADAFVRFGNLYGMNIEQVGERSGQASAMKMARSAFVKGFTMLLFEAMDLAEQYGATDTVLASLEQTLRSRPLNQTVNNLMTRTIPHAERRIAEMDEVIGTLAAEGLDDAMSKATRQKLERLNNSGLNAFFNHETPESFKDVLKAMAQRRKESQPRGDIRGESKQ